MEQNPARKRIFGDEGAFMGNENIIHFPACKNCFLAFKDGDELDPERFICQIYSGKDSNGEWDDTKEKPDETSDPSYQCPYKVINK